jgi:hypothetical protein
MNKKVYLQPAIEATEFDMDEQLLATSVHATGLGVDEDLTQDETPGDAWGNAMSRRRNVWDDDEEEEW